MICDMVSTLYGLRSFFEPHLPRSPVDPLTHIPSGIGDDFEGGMASSGEPARSGSARNR